MSDRDGGITTINHEDESKWTKRSSGNAGWMVRCDEIGIYHGHSQGVTMYDWEDGQVIWNQPTQGDVLFGWQEESMIYVGTYNKLVQSFTKKAKSALFINVMLPSIPVPPQAMVSIYLLVTTVLRSIVSTVMAIASGNWELVAALLIQCSSLMGGYTSSQLTALLLVLMLVNLPFKLLKQGHSLKPLISSLRN